MLFIFQVNVSWHRVGILVVIIGRTEIYPLIGLIENGSDGRIGRCIFRPNPPYSWICKDGGCYIIERTRACTVVNIVIPFVDIDIDIAPSSRPYHHPGVHSIFASVLSIAFPNHGNLSKWHASPTISVCICTACIASTPPITNLSSTNTQRIGPTITQPPWCRPNYHVGIVPSS